MPFKIIALSGRVVKGQRFGRKLGFPTANLDRKAFSKLRVKLKLGIYKGSTTLPSGKSFLSAIVIGPLDRKRLPKIETYLIGFTGNLYGKKVAINLEKFIRPFKNFKSVEELKKQIAKDVKVIKTI